MGEPSAPGAEARVRRGALATDSNFAPPRRWLRARRGAGVLSNVRALGRLPAAQKPAGAMANAAAESDEEVYDVEKVLEKRAVGGGFEYRIRWLGYGPAHDTWEPLSNLQNSKSLVVAFERRAGQGAGSPAASPLPSPSSSDGSAAGPGGGGGGLVGGGWQGWGARAT